MKHHRSVWKLLACW